MMNAACTNKFFSYNMMHTNEASLFDFKRVVSPFLVGCYIKKVEPYQRIKLEPKKYKINWYLFEYSSSQIFSKQCAYYYKEGFGRKQTLDELSLVFRLFDEKDQIIP